MSENGRSSNKPVPYSDKAVILPLSVIQKGGSVRDACRAVDTEFGKRPDVHTVHAWTQRSSEAFSKLQPEKRRDWEHWPARCTRHGPIAP